jgi:rhodanese-related sulfurtransferase
LNIKTNRMNISAIIEANAILVDVRTADEFAGGHIEGAINIPLSFLMERKHEINGLGNSPVIFYCRSGNRSGSAVTLLQQHGYSKIYNGGSMDQLQHMLDNRKKY